MRENKVLCIIRRATTTHKKLSLLVEPTRKENVNIILVFQKKVLSCKFVLC